MVFSKMTKIAVERVLPRVSSYELRFKFHLEKSEQALNKVDIINTSSKLK